MTGPRTRFSPYRSRGFTLVEIVVVLIIVSVLISMAAMMTRGVVAAQKRSLTSTRLAAVDQALAQFVSQQKRLPCPADGTLTAGNANLGTEGNRSAGNGCTGNQQNGIVPFRALGLTETDALDGWGRRMTYRVGPLLAADSGMDLSFCDPAGTAAASGTANVCATTCTTGAAMSSCTSPGTFLVNKGLQVRDVSGNVLMAPNTVAANPSTAAAYVVVSPGETGGGGYLPSGTLGSSTTTDGTEELKNYASVAFVNNTVTYYVDDGINDTAGTTHFDDLVSRPSILMVASRAGLAARAH